MDDSVIICDESTDDDTDADAEAKSNDENFNEKKATCKTQIFMFYLHFY